MPDAELAALAAQVTAMGRENERTQRRLAELESLIRDLAARFEAGAAAGTDGESEGNDARSWLAPADPDEGHALLADLLDWLARIYLRYPG
ncbi:MAG TPA: hypothetical protein VHH34_14590, partial [Pseudonocardiaceae bacterium]|nr:hypothetical protein [Pseudonocardiaceae bacterium]